VTQYRTPARAWGQQQDSVEYLQIEINTVKKKSEIISIILSLSFILLEQFALFPKQVSKFQVFCGCVRKARSARKSQSQIFWSENLYQSNQYKLIF